MTAPADAISEDFLGSVGLLAMEMLRVFHHEGSFGAVKERMNIDQRIVSRTLIDLNTRFREYSGGSDLLERPDGSRNYKLTSEGIELASQLDRINQSMREAIQASARTKPILTVPVTNNCLELLKDLGEALRNHKSEIVLFPLPKRSADFASIHGHSEMDSVSEGIEHARTYVPYAFYSAALPDDGHVTRGAIVSRPDLEILCIKWERFMLLALEDDIGMSPNEPISVGDIFNRDLTLLVPRGGAVWDFLDHAEPSWYRRNQSMDATDLHCGLDCLRLRLAPHSVMIVHGFSPSDKRIPEGYRLYPLKANEEYRAITGLVRRPSMVNMLRKIDRENWAEVWREALSLWRTPK